MEQYNDQLTEHVVEVGNRKGELKFLLGSDMQGSMNQEDEMSTLRTYSTTSIEYAESLLPTIYTSFLSPLLR